jgi:hypothetical protein
LGSSPKPNQMISSGAIAMIGRVCEATSSGVRARRSQGDLRAHPGGGDEPLPGDQPDGDEDEGRQDGGEGAADAPGADGGRFRRAPGVVSMVALLRSECSKATMLRSAKRTGLHHGAP